MKGISLYGIASDLGEFQGEFRKVNPNCTKTFKVPISNGQELNDLLKISEGLENLYLISGYASEINISQLSWDSSNSLKEFSIAGYNLTQEHG